MLNISRAVSLADFEIAAEMASQFAAWDAEQCRAQGLDEETVIALFHQATAESIAADFSGDSGALMIARWDGQAAGCLGFELFDGGIAEIKNFFVDPAFRGRNIGRSLLTTVMGMIDTTKVTDIVLQTTVYMANATSLYRAFGFKACEPFRDVPEFLRETEVFMHRPALLREAQEQA